MEEEMTGRSETEEMQQYFAAAANPQTIRESIERKPFTPPFSQMKRGGVEKREGFARGKAANKVKSESIYVVYDPALKCYYEPKTGIYYDNKSLGA